jgi:hypothetical protein
MTAEPRATGTSRSAWIGGSVCAVVGLAMLAWTWRRWPDVLVDFGGELYVPWRLREGDVLYRDVAYFTGPLSPYVNALWFRIFGTSFLALALANVGILALIATLLLNVLEKAGDRVSACAATVIFLVLFAFAQLEIYGNSNYVAPYAHETTHGTLIALATIAALECWLRCRERSWLAAAGFLLGLSFLTKVEYFVAIACACALSIAGGFASPRGDRSLPLRARPRLADMGLFLLLAIAAPALAFLLLAAALGPSAALQGVSGAWMYVFDSRITSLRFYEFVMGTDRPAENARLALQWLLPHAVVLGVPLALALAIKKKRGALSFALPLVAIPALVLTLQPSPRAWLEAFRPLPIFMVVAAVAWSLAALRAKDAMQRRRALLRASFSAFALVLLGKMILNARLQGYGYALAMPATMVYCTAIVSWIPRAIEARSGDGALFRGAALGWLAAAIVSHVAIMRGYFDAKTIEVGKGADAFLADARGTVVDAALAALEERMKPSDTLAVLPEGVMLDYLLRQRTPARYINYMPPELLMFGEERILADFEAHPPEWIALTHKPTSEYGLPYFGQDYGQRLFGWITAHYAAEATLGDPPLQRGSRFGIRILRRKT